MSIYYNRILKTSLVPGLLAPGTYPPTYQMILTTTCYVQVVVFLLYREG